MNLRTFELISPVNSGSDLGVVQQTWTFLCDVFVPSTSSSQYCSHRELWSASHDGIAEGTVEAGLKRNS